jgi:ribosomal protein S24E
MKIDIASEKHNPLMKRKELLIDIENTEEATPSKAQLTELLTRHAHKDADHIEIVKIDSGRGFARSKALAFVWDEKRVVKEKKKEEAKKE